MQKGFSLIELVIAMTILGLSLLAYQMVLYSTMSSLNVNGNDNDVIDLANDRFNEFVVTNTLGSGSTDKVNVTPSGSAMTFTSAKDSQINVSLSL